MPLPHPTDESKPGTLPNPELNPLLNPLLAAHMGRWAEVYFANPPEKRGAAVAELLRELQASSPSAAPGIDVAVEKQHEGHREAKPGRDDLLYDHVQKTNAAEKTRNWTSSAVETPTICRACGHKNAPGQKFCGMCGTALVTQSAPVSAASWEEFALPKESFGNDAVEAAQSLSADGSYDEQESERHPTSVPTYGVESEPVPFRYRLYIGVMLAILLALLVYMAWRGTRVFSGTRPSAASAEPAGARLQLSSPQQPAVLPTDSSTGIQPAASPGSASQPAANPAAASPATVEPPSKPVNARPANTRPASALLHTAAHTSRNLTQADGGAELTAAERDLNAVAGSARDSKEAALWLWKAVGKGNVEAMIALSDLYLRGDGVARSCDQARLLLDAAARKGGKAAAERLRHLQAFGCQ